MLKDQRLPRAHTSKTRVFKQMPPNAGFVGSRVNSIDLWSTLHFPYGLMINHSSFLNPCLSVHFLNLSARHYINTILFNFIYLSPKTLVF